MGHRTAAAIAAIVLAATGCGRGCAKSTSDAGPTTSPEPRPALHAIPVRPTMQARYAVLVGASKSELEPRLSPPRLAALVDTRTCGPVDACERVRAFVGSAEFHVDVRDASDWKLPEDAPESARTARSAVVVHASAPVTPEAIALRATFAVTAALARELGGIVAEEETDRIDSSASFASQVVTSSLGDGVYRNDRVAVEVVDDDTNPELVQVTLLGLGKFGLHDLVAGPLPKDDAPRAFGVLDAVARAVTAGERSAPVALGPTWVDVVPTPVREGDRASRLRVVPEGGSTARSWTSLFAATRADAGPSAKDGQKLVDPEALERTRAGARATVDAVARDWETHVARGDTVLVLLPFAADGGPTEAMWIEVTHIDPLEVRGVLVNSPVSIPGLVKGERVTRRVDAILDVTITGADGTSAKGTSAGGAR
ncbi:MAG: DUF2314 domain-containing protein [Polyangiaceae bacterium]